MPNPFSDDVMAAGYAAARPAVHPLVIELLRGWLGDTQIRVAADLGCGAGLSTRPLLSLADVCVGFDPAPAMVRAALRATPQARFAVAGAEAIPLDAASVGLITAAGSLNYAKDLDAVWPEARRVLAPGGTLAVYDFSPGRTFPNDETLDAWFAAFTTRFPYPASQARPLSPGILAGLAQGFALRHGETFALPLPMSPAAYVDYVLTETNVRHATDAGTPSDDVRAWCESTIGPLFSGRLRDVLFTGYLAVLQPVD